MRLSISSASLQGTRSDDRDPFIRGPIKARWAPRFPEEPVLLQIVSRLNEIERQTGIERTLSIGELILERFFAGDASVWRDRRRNKNNSIRRLASRDDCPLGKSALNEAVGVFVATRKIPCVRTYGHISASHVAAVLSLSIEEQKSMLLEAQQGAWSVRHLKEVVTSRNRERGERRGRPKSAPVTGSVGSLRGLVRGCHKALRELDGVTLHPDIRGELLDVADGLLGLEKELRRICQV